MKINSLYLILAVIFVILLLAVLKINKKDVKLEFNKLTSFLGGKDNIIDTEVNLSRFIVTVKDINKVDKDAIIELGAKGIVEIDNQLKIIYPKVSLTYGYITKNTRIKNGLAKEHYIDARCISGNPNAIPLGVYYYQKKVRCHNRQIHKSNPQARTIYPQVVQILSTATTAHANQLYQFYSFYQYEV